MVLKYIMKTIGVLKKINEMEYEICHNRTLVIKNSSGRVIFINNKKDIWFKYEFDHNDKQISFEDSGGNIRHYNR